MLVLVDSPSSSMINNTRRWQNLTACMHTRKHGYSDEPDQCNASSCSEGNPTHCGQSKFVANRNMAFRECSCNSMTAQPLTRIPSRVQPFASGLVHKQRSHRLRHKLRANSDQIEQSLPRLALASLRPEMLQVLPKNVDLDLRLHGDMLEQGVLDTSILSGVDNPFRLYLAVNRKCCRSVLSRTACQET